MVDVSIEAENVTQLRLLQRGDHIAVEGEMAGVKYYHHGIFLGHSIGVADFGGTNKVTATVRIVDILEFTDQGKRLLVRYRYRRSECLPAEEAARNAEALAANPRLWGAYDLIKNNCEHFATRCKVGRAVSFQVLQMLRKFVGLLASPATSLAASSSLSVGASVYMANNASK
ncbi:lecithin retinol acyltransferase-like [Mercenaria mercenaria]|uniref:lecithin retinol acyltransferase-like n=1 Tax=Mercenaria mercenaria TaxID=6596 RepID=UPI00234F954A|nr:lecithin retinol acyltransferase-like [Mercenaria mercenaria]